MTYVLVFLRVNILHAAQKREHSGISEHMAALGLEKLHPLELHFAPILRGAFLPRCTLVQLGVFPAAL
jgi:hypothetical protein